MAGFRGGAPGLLLAFAAVLGACAQGASDPATPNTGPKTVKAPTSGSSSGSAAGVAQVQSQTFSQWRDSFRARAVAEGISASTFDAAFKGVQLNDQVQSLDRKQPEFSRPIWEYLDSAVSSSRVSTGRKNAEQKRSVLQQIESRYGVDYPVVVAIWGLESGYGANFGSIPVIESLATLAYDGRRQKFAEEQLIAALRILEAGDITPGRMVGSWAGAMGHTQFIPTSFLEYAVDFTGDGRRDLWSADAVDALASTASYLSRFGWRQGAPAVVEVRLPAGFDYLQASPSVTASASAWTSRGLQPVRGGTLPPADDVSIILPAGARGPAFAAYPNFKVIKRYNNSTSYALAVAHLADRIQGGPAFAGGWPRDDRTLSRTEKQELQERLTGMGFDTQGIDGIIGPNSRDAVRAFQSSRGLTPDGYVSSSLLSAVRSASG